MEPENTKAFLVLRNLNDAGCEPKLIEKLLKLKEEGKTEEQLRLLKRHRTSLLATVHENQKRIDCLDYYVFTIRKKTDKA